MIRHHGMDHIPGPPLRHMAADAVTAGCMRDDRDLRQRVTIDSRLVIPGSALRTMPNVMRVVTSTAAKFPLALEETLRLAKAVHRTHDLKLVGLAGPWRVIERQLKRAKRFPRAEGERATVVEADGIGQHPHRRFEMTQMPFLRRPGFLFSMRTRSRRKRSEQIDPPGRAPTGEGKAILPVAAGFSPRGALSSASS